MNFVFIQRCMGSLGTRCGGCVLPHLHCGDGRISPQQRGKGAPGRARLGSFRWTVPGPGSQDSVKRLGGPGRRGNRSWSFCGRCHAAAYRTRGQLGWPKPASKAQQKRCFKPGYQKSDLTNCYLLNYNLRWDKGREKLFWRFGKTPPMRNKNVEASKMLLLQQL